MIQVQATDLETGDRETHEIDNDYVVTCAGTAEFRNVTVHHRTDGTQTHVITISGIRPQ